MGPKTWNDSVVRPILGHRIIVSCSDCNVWLRNQWCNADYTTDDIEDDSTSPTNSSLLPRLRVEGDTAWLGNCLCPRSVIQSSWMILGQLDVSTTWYRNTTSRLNLPPLFRRSNTADLVGDSVQIFTDGSLPNWTLSQSFWEFVYSLDNQTTVESFRPKFLQ